MFVWKKDVIKITIEILLDDHIFFLKILIGISGRKSSWLCQILYNYWPSSGSNVINPVHLGINEHSNPFVLSGIFSRYRIGLFEFPQPFPGMNWPFSLDIIVGMAKWVQTIKITKIDEEILSGTMSQSYNDLWQMSQYTAVFLVSAEFLLETKSLYISRTVSCFYDTEFEIWASFGPAGSTNNFCNFPKVFYFW